MGDAGEGLVDNESRIQERMEELRAERERSKKPRAANPDDTRKLDSLKLAKTQLTNQLGNTQNAARRAQIQKALDDLENQITPLQASLEARS